MTNSQDIWRHNWSLILRRIGVEDHIPAIIELIETEKRATRKLAITEALAVVSEVLEYAPTPKLIEMQASIKKLLS